MRNFWYGVIVVVSVAAGVYEGWALIASHPHLTISRIVRNLAEAYHPVYWFGGIITGFLLVMELFLRLPTLIRCAILVWIMTSAHIFWALG